MEFSTNNRCGLLGGLQDDYCETVFGVGTSRTDCTWLFSTHWDSEDNTPKGGASRIRYFLKNGVPENFTTSQFFTPYLFGLFSTNFSFGHTEEYQNILESY